MDVTWPLQDAKQRLSEVVRAAESGVPQIVSRHGEPVVVMIEIAEYRRLLGQTTDFKDFLLAAPYADELEPERVRELPRAIDLSSP